MFACRVIVYLDQYVSVLEVEPCESMHVFVFVYTRVCTLCLGWTDRREA